MTFLKNNFSTFIYSFFFFVLALQFSSCSSARKERSEQREKIASNAGMYCDFINGEQFVDVEVVLNIEMAKKCDSTKPFSVSHYRNSSDVNGMVYCCSMMKKSETNSAAAKTSSNSTGAAGAGSAAKAAGSNTGATTQPSSSAAPATPAANPSNSNHPTNNKKDSPKDSSFDEVISE